MILGTISTMSALLTLRLSNHPDVVDGNTKNRSFGTERRTCPSSVKGVRAGTLPDPKHDCGDKPVLLSLDVR